MLAAVIISLLSGCVKHCSRGVMYGISHLHNNLIIVSIDIFMYGWQNSKNSGQQEVLGRLGLKLCSLPDTFCLWKALEAALSSWPEALVWSLWELGTPYCQAPKAKASLIWLIKVQEVTFWFRQFITYINRRRKGSYHGISPPWSLSFIVMLKQHKRGQMTSMCGVGCSVAEESTKQLLPSASLFWSRWGRMLHPHQNPEVTRHCLVTAFLEIEEADETWSFCVPHGPPSICLGDFHGFVVGCYIWKFPQPSGPQGPQSLRPLTWSIGVFFSDFFPGVHQG